jgi:hypothetical protein
MKVRGHCWTYDSFLNSWSHTTTRRLHTLNKQFVEQPGNVFEDKLFLLHEMVNAYIIFFSLIQQELPMAEIAYGKIRYSPNYKKKSNPLTTPQSFISFPNLTFPGPLKGLGGFAF